MKSLHLHIDRIVVEGLPESGQRRFRRALEFELQQLAESGVPASIAESSIRKRIQAVNAGPLRPGTTPEQAAAQVARSIRQSAFPSEKTQGAADNSAVSPTPSDASGATTNTSGREARPHA